jgi:Flp pilus assembly protein CpaB
MTATQTGFPAQPQSAPRIPPHQVSGRLPTRQRRPALIAVAVLLIVSGALGGLQLLTASSHTVSVLVLVRPVPAGHVIASADLRTTALSGNVAYTLSSAEATVVGKTAARDLFAGQLLTQSMMATASVPAATQALVGLRLSAAQVPSAGLADGNTVVLVQVPSADGSAAVTAPPASGQATAPSGAAGGVTAPNLVLATGTVYAIAADTASARGALITVLVPREQSEALSVAASSGQVTLIRVGS